MEEDYVSEIEQKIKEIAWLLHKNPRIKTVDINIQTLMGCSVSYSSLGDEHSPICQVIKAKEKRASEQNAIQKYQRVAPSHKETTLRSPEDLQRGLQQFV